MLYHYKSVLCFAFSIHQFSIVKLLVIKIILNHFAKAVINKGDPCWSFLLLLLPTFECISLNVSCTIKNIPCLITAGTLYCTVKNILLQ